MRAAGLEFSSSRSAQMRSLACPGEGINSTGLLNASTSAQILVLNLQRDGRIACSSFVAHRHYVDEHVRSWRQSSRLPLWSRLGSTRPTVSIAQGPRETIISAAP